MTQEQYDRVVEIHDRLDKLEEVKGLIKSPEDFYLSYSHKIQGGEYVTFPKWRLSHVGDILDRHDRMIREEIDEEIEKLKKEIETL